jgi:hypothetical protein
MESSENELLNLVDSELWSEHYLSYLSRYSSNLIGITAPKVIQIEVNQSNFSKLFEKWISLLPQENPVTKISQEERLSGFIQTTLKAHTNINQKLTHSIIPGILFPFVISSVGKNERPFICEFLDFDTNITKAKNRIHHTLHLNQVFSTNNEVDSTIYFVSDEPKLTLAGREIWTNLREWSNVNVVSENEVELITAYVEQHGVMPLVSKT